MATTNKKQTFLGGAAVLAAATAIVKIIGAFYKIPLAALIGDEGFGYFNTAYDIYSVLLMVSTTGLPVAMSRMVSEASTLGRTRQIERIYKTARQMFLLIGAVGAVGMALLCYGLASLMSQKQSWFAILCLSPAVLFICMISAERGFFQGQGNMLPTSVSQVVEALCKLVVGLVLAFVLGRITGKMSYAAGGAILGVTLGTFVSVIVLTRWRRKAAANLHLDCLDPTVETTRTTARKLLSIAIPITLGAAGLQFITMIDTAVYMGQLKNVALPKLGIVEPDELDKLGDKLKGVYNFAQTVFNMPCAFITPITVSAIPAITAQLTLGKRRQANVVAESGTRVMSLIAMPCVVGLVVLAEPVMQLLRGYSGTWLELAGVLMRVLAFCIFFNSFVLVLNAILQAHGYVYLPVINMVVGGLVKVIINFILVGNPRIHIVGVPVGTVVCYMVIAMLDLIAINRVLKNPPRLITNTLKPMLAALVMGAAVWFVRVKIEARFVESDVAERIQSLIVVIASVLVAFVVYGGLVYLLKVVTKEDCALLPKGEKIARLLRIK